MARPKQDGLPKWNPRRTSFQKMKSDNFKVRYKALRSASSNFIKREDVRDYLLKKYDHKCYICGSSENLQIDHIVSVYRFSSERLEPSVINSEENLAVICMKCNSAKNPEL